MSEQTKEPGPPAADSEGAVSTKGPNRLTLPVVVALMTIAGALTGTMAIAPKLLSVREAAGLEAPDSTADGSGAHDESGVEQGSGPTYRIDNLIVNPSGSQGSRFLMVSLAVETPDAHMEERLRQKEAQIRDVVISILERQTMESLGAEGIRDSLKSQLSDTISAIAAARPKLRVFLPQFVIQ